MILQRFTILIGSVLLSSHCGIFHNKANGNKKKTKTLFIYYSLKESAPDDIAVDGPILRRYECSFRFFKTGLKLDTFYNLGEDFFTQWLVFLRTTNEFSLDP